MIKRHFIAVLLSILVFSIIIASPTWATVTISPPSAAAPVCTNSKPGTPTLSSLLVTGANQVALYWTQASNATSWTVAYGRVSGNYSWGFADFGDTNSRSATVSYLSPGTYYFAARANNGCMPGDFSGERSIRVAGAAMVTEVPALVPEAEAAPRIVPPAAPPAAVQPAPPPAGPITTVIRLGLPLALGVTILGTAAFIIYKRWVKGEE